MQYVLLIYGDEAGWEGATDDERQATYADALAIARRIPSSGTLRGVEVRPVVQHRRSGCAAAR